MKSNLIRTMFALLFCAASFAHANEFLIDTRGKHAFIQFKVSHLGYGFVIGEFTDFTGRFTYDETNPSASEITIDIDTKSVDSAHAERDRHLRGKDFLHVRKYPKAKFVGDDYRENADGSGTLNGQLTLHGETRPVEIAVTKIGAGKDPWGGYRAGFEGTATITLADFGITYNLGPASRTADLYFVIEGIRQ